MMGELNELVWITDDHAVTREQTRHADQKAQILASGLVPSIAAAVAAGAFAGITGPAAAVGWTAAALAAVAVACLGGVLWPRHGTRPTTETREDVLRRFLESDLEQRLDAAVDELLRLRAVITVKYQLLRLALSLTAFAGLLAAATVVLAFIA